VRMASTSSSSPRPITCIFPSNDKAAKAEILICDLNDIYPADEAFRLLGIETGRRQAFRFAVRGFAGPRPQGQYWRDVERYVGADISFAP